ncbi:peptidylprolyl isomerase [Streptomyces sp. NPDC088864]|uniref:peptidylprolyl isomerase n=1 Tax=Streptomyces sp. NPDC088864 TaxID=3365910 RepID=UPI00380366C3
MVSSDQRRRQLAREKYERQQRRREEARRRSRRLMLSIASAVAVVAVIGGATYFATRGDDGKDKTDAAASQSPSAEASPTEKPKPEPPMKIDKKARYEMSLKTSQGDIAFTMDASKTPHTTNSFKSLADKKFFDGTTCHRLTVGNVSVLQCGDPTGAGSGGPGYTIPDENLTTLGKADKDGYVVYPAGTVAMANTGQPHSGGSQFFLVYKDSKLPPAYTPFGTLDEKSLKVVQAVGEAGVEGGAPEGAPKKAVKIAKLTVDKV